MKIRSALKLSGKLDHGKRTVHEKYGVKLQMDLAFQKHVVLTSHQQQSFVKQSVQVWSC